jgi:uncharacterized protein (DUF302 family)
MGPVALTHSGGVVSAQATDNGFITVSSHHSVPETVDRLESQIKARQLTLFAHIDFSGDAQREGLPMQLSQLLVFGSPRAGTPLMQAVPTAALDLPLKVLVWEDAGQRVWISYNSANYLEQRHKAHGELMKPLSGAAARVSAAAAD